MKINTGKDSDGNETSSSVYYFSYQFLLIPTALGATKANSGNNRNLCGPCRSSSSTLLKGDKEAKYTGNNIHLINVNKEIISEGIYSKLQENDEKIVEILYNKDNVNKFGLTTSVNQSKDTCLKYFGGVAILLTGIIEPWLFSGFKEWVLYYSGGWILFGIIFVVIYTLIFGCDDDDFPVEFTVSRNKDEIQEYINKMNQLARGKATKWKDNLARNNIRVEDYLTDNYNVGSNNGNNGNNTNNNTNNNNNANNNNLNTIVVRSNSVTDTSGMDNQHEALPAYDKIVN